MAYEVLIGESYDERCDVFSLGIMFLNLFMIGNPFKEF